MDKFVVKIYLAQKYVVHMKTADKADSCASVSLSDIFSKWDACRKNAYARKQDTETVILSEYMIAIQL